MHSLSASKTKVNTRVRRPGWEWLAAAAALADLALIVVAALGWRPGMGVPADLVYSTTRLSERGLYRVSFAASEPAIPIAAAPHWLAAPTP